MTQPARRTPPRPVAAGIAVALLAATYLGLGPAAAAVAADDIGTKVDGRGTVLGTASYALPTNAVFASSGTGSDSNSGTLSSPVKTLEKALALANAGGTVVLRAGNYHESVIVKKTVTIQNYPKEVVWLDGSARLATWTKSGSTWSSPWDFVFSAQASHSDVRSDFPMANNPDQVFVNGQQLRQVGSLSSVTSGTFYADKAGRRLVIGSDPTGKTVSASKLERAIETWAPNVALKGIGIRRYANTASTGRAAVVSNTEGGTFENLVISDNALIGLALGGSRQIIRNVVLERNGMMGLSAHKASGSSVSNSVIRYNNYERFPATPVASGAKFTWSSNVTFNNNTVTDNYLAAGAWFDEYGSNVVVTNNKIQDNGATQLNLELNRRGTVANNLISGGNKGIELRATEDSRVFNNTIGNYGTMGISVSQDSRSVTRPSVAPAEFSLKNRNNTISNNVFTCGARFQIFANDETGRTSVDQFNLSITGNLFSPHQKSPELNMVTWGMGGGKYDFIQSPAALTSKNAAWKNGQSTSCSDPKSSLSSSISSIAVPLPSDIAQAIGVASGSRLVGVASQAEVSEAPNQQPPTVSEGPAVLGVVTDSFSRAASTSWGRTDSGHDWLLSGGTSAFTTSNNAGYVDLLPGQTREASIKTDPSSSSFTSLVTSFERVQSSGSSSVSLVGRRVGSSYYAGSLWLAADGTLRLYALRDSTQLVNSQIVGTNYKSGQAYNVKVEVTGVSPTTVRAKAWPSGQTEPTSWTISATDSAAHLQTAGSTSLRTYLAVSGKGSTRISVDNYRLEVK